MNNKKLLRICAFVSGISGFIILVSVLFPIAQYEATSRQKYPSLISPIVEEDETRVTFEDMDYTRASNWFSSGAKREDFVSSKVSHYTLSIPSLGIEDATVAIGGEDLSENLIQYPQTALPGKTGNTVIFGHSILSYFFDPEITWQSFRHYPN